MLRDGCGDWGGVKRAGLWRGGGGCNREDTEEAGVPILFFALQAKGPDPNSWVGAFNASRGASVKVLIFYHHYS